jgi:nucleotidyltransferase/DNA polymerase involved in DNA repair
MFMHVDADAFFASALQRKNPRLRGKPLLALGMGGGCVIAASYEAKVKGVKTGMTLRDARALCPRATAIPSDFHEACKASQEIELILNDVCPFVERMSVDEWYLELATVPGGIPKSLEAWSKKLQNDIGTRVGLTVSAGIAPSKTLSKMAGEYRKPAGTTILQKRDIQWFLRDRPTLAIPGIGRRRGLHTDSFGWKTAWDFAQANDETVLKLFGKPGRELQLELRGVAVYDLEREDKPPKSISRCRSFKRTNDRTMIFSHLLDHFTYTMIKMRRHNLGTTEISIWLRDGEYQHWSTGSKLPQVMDTEDQILPYLQRCFGSLYEQSRTCTQVGFGLLQLKPKGASQYSLFEDLRTVEHAERIQGALDAVHDKYGREALARASTLVTNVGNVPRLHAV